MELLQKHYLKSPNATVDPGPTSPAAAGVATKPAGDEKHLTELEGELKAAQDAAAAAVQRVKQAEKAATAQRVKEAKEAAAAQQEKAGEAAAAQQSTEAAAAAAAAGSAERAAKARQAADGVLCTS